MSYFSDLALPLEILRGLRKLGHCELTPIQKEAIPLLMNGLDVIGQAQTGTGKTAAFGIPLVLEIDAEKAEIQGLVLAPTRELALQVSRMLKSYSKYTDVKTVVIYGGESIDNQINRIKKGAHIVVGTPGRIIDLLKKRVFSLNSVKVVVIDEADKLMEMGFIKDVGFILSKVPFVHQTSLWSATINDEVTSIARQFMRQPRKIFVSEDEVAQPLVEQFFIEVNSDKKTSTLSKLLDDTEIEQAIIFCNTREMTEVLAEELNNRGILVNALHGRFNQAKRDKVVKAFSTGKLRILVSSDVASRGLDISGVSHVFNFDIPHDPEVYFHRIGRTGRMETEGKSVSLVTPEDKHYFDIIKSLTDLKIKEYKI